MTNPEPQRVGLLPALQRLYVVNPAQAAEIVDAARQVDCVWLPIPLRLRLRSRPNLKTGDLLW